MAQTKGLKLNIQDAKDYALQNNKTYQNAQDDVALAETQIKEVVVPDYRRYRGVWNT